MLLMEIIYGNGRPVKLIDYNGIVYDVIPHWEDNIQDKDDNNAKIQTM